MIEYSLQDDWVRYGWRGRKGVDGELFDGDEDGFGAGLFTESLGWEREGESGAAEGGWDGAGRGRVLLGSREGRGVV